MSIITCEDPHTASGTQSSQFFPELRNHFVWQSSHSTEDPRSVWSSEPARSPSKMQGRHCIHIFCILPGCRETWRMLSGYAKESRVQIAVDMITGPLLLGGFISLVSRRASFRGRGLGETAHCFLGTATPEKAPGPAWFLGSLPLFFFSVYSVEI